MPTYLSLFLLLAIWVVETSAFSAHQRLVQIRHHPSHPFGLTDIQTRRHLQPWTSKTLSYLQVANERMLNDGMEECDSINIPKLVEDIVAEATSAAYIDPTLAMDQRMMQEAIKVAASWYVVLSTASISV